MLRYGDRELQYLGSTGEPDVIVECTGVGAVIGASIQKVGAGGVVSLTGVGAGGVSSRAVSDVAAAVLKNNVLVAVNYAPHPSQCYVNLPFPEIKDQSVQLKDCLSSASYTREGNALLERGLYLDLQP